MKTQSSPLPILAIVWVNSDKEVSMSFINTFVILYILAFKPQENK